MNDIYIILLAIITGVPISIENSSARDRAEKVEFNLTQSRSTRLFIYDYDGSACIYEITWFENSDRFEATAFTSVGRKLPVPAHQFLCARHKIKPRNQ